MAIKEYVRKTSFLWPSEMAETESDHRFGQCRCCLDVGYHKDIAEPYHRNGARETYRETFLKCFNLVLSTNTKLTNMICTSCISRLNDASEFVTMVVESEKQLLKQINNTPDIEFINVTEDHDGGVCNHDEDDNNQMKVEDDVDCSNVEDDISVQEEEKSNNNDNVSLKQESDMEFDSVEDKEIDLQNKEEDDIECNDIDGEEVNTQVAVVNSQASTEDEYYDDQMHVCDQIVKKQMSRKKLKCENILKDKSRSTVSHHKFSNKMQRNKDEVVATELQRVHEVVSPEIQTEGPEGVSQETEKGSCEQRHDYKKMGKRRWDRRNACFYCQELVTNYSRHLLRKHPNEIEVIKYKSIIDVDLKVRKQKRQEITDKLRNKGNFLHNSKVSFDRDVAKTILPAKRSTQESNPSAFATCKMCLGTFKRSTFFRHFRKCGAGANDGQTMGCNRRVLCNNTITIIPNTDSESVELRDKVLPYLRSDEISLVVKNDSLILAYGSRLLKKKKERRSRKAVCSKMRDLASLLIVLRKKDHSIETLTDVIDPENFEVFMDGIKTMCGIDEETGFVKVASIPARMRPSILGCIDILNTQSIMSTESTAYKDAYSKKLSDFKRLVEINWEWEISPNAEKTRKRKI